MDAFGAERGRRTSRSGRLAGFALPRCLPDEKTRPGDSFTGVKCSVMKSGILFSIFYGSKRGEEKRERKRDLQPTQKSHDF